MHNRDADVVSILRHIGSSVSIDAPVRFRGRAWFGNTSSVLGWLATRLVAIDAVEAFPFCGRPLGRLRLRFEGRRTVRGDLDCHGVERGRSPDLRPRLSRVVLRGSSAPRGRMLQSGQGGRFAYDPPCSPLERG